MNNMYKNNTQLCIISLITSFMFLLGIFGSMTGIIINIFGIRMLRNIKKDDFNFLNKITQILFVISMMICSISIIINCLNLIR